LNGYYLVHGKENQLETPNSSTDINSQIEIVECRFRQKPKTENQGNKKIKALRPDNKNNC